MVAGAQPAHGLGEAQSILQIRILYGELHHDHQQERPRGARDHGDLSYRQRGDGYSSTGTP